MEKQSWVIKEDGDIQYRLLTAKNLERALDVMKIAFYPDENMCRAVDLAKNPKAIAEVLETTIALAKDGVTVIAVDKNLDKVVGVSFNKILERDAGYFIPTLTEQESTAVLKTLLEFEGSCDIYGISGSSCIFEIVCLATLAEYRGKGIARKLCEAGIEVAKKLSNGENVKQPIDDEPLPLGPKPEAVTSVFTSIKTQKIGRALQFEIATTESFDNFYYQGRPYSKVIGSETKNVTYEYKKL